MLVVSVSRPNLATLAAAMLQLGLNQSEPIWQPWRRPVCGPLCCVMLCYVVLCCVMLCYVVLCCVMLCYSELFAVVGLI